MTSHSEERDEVDAVIDRCKMIERTGLSREELHAKVDKALMCLNLTRVLADVIETLVMDAEAILRPFGATFEREDKQHYRQLTRTLYDARKCAQRLCGGIYASDQADEYANECDWWYNIIRLIEERTGSDQLKTKQVIQWLATMPSVLNMFNVKTLHFKRLIDD